MKHLKSFNGMLENNNLNIPVEYFDMANALDVKKAIVPELRKNNISFTYDSYSNFLDVQVTNEDQVKIAKRIILEDGDGVVAENEEQYNDDGAIIRQKPIL